MTFSSSSSEGEVDEEEYDEILFDQTLMWGVIIVEFVIIVSLSITLLTSMGLLILIYRKALKRA